MQNLTNQIISAVLHRIFLKLYFFALQGNAIIFIWSLEDHSKNKKKYLVFSIFYTFNKKKLERFLMIHLFFNDTFCTFFYRSVFLNPIQVDENKKQIQKFYVCKWTFDSKNEVDKKKQNQKFLSWIQTSHNQLQLS